MGVFVNRITPRLFDRCRTINRIPEKFPSKPDFDRDPAALSFPTKTGPRKKQIYQPGFQKNPGIFQNNFENIRSHQLAYNLPYLNLDYDNDPGIYLTGVNRGRSVVQNSNKCVGFCGTQTFCFPEPA